MKRAFVLHPFLFAVFPVIALYHHNIGELSLSQLWVPLAAAFGFGTVLLMLSWFFLKDIKKAGIIASISLVLFFSYGHILNLIRGWGDFHVGGVLVGTPSRYLLLIYAILFIAGVYFTVKTHRNLHSPTNALNVAAITLVAISSVSTVIYEVQRPDFAPGYEVSESAIASGDMVETLKLPDIYYIVLDSYASDSALNEFYNFANREFTDDLSRRGFYVASQSRSNYLHTEVSLASSLSMDYINYLSNKFGEGCTAVGPLRNLVEDNEVGQFLKSRSYKYIHVGSIWDATWKNDNADINFSPNRRASEFDRLLYSTTALSAFPNITIKLGLRSLPHDPKEHRESVLYQFERLAEIPNMKAEMDAPVFVFAHVVIPHQPFVFQQDGSILTEQEAASRTVSENYVNQLTFCNKKLTTIVDKILSRSEVAPIIILQGDHGPANEGTFSDWSSLDEGGKIRLNSGILNAYYLTGSSGELLYDSITPVNTFRLIFNYYLGAHYELLPDKTYSSPLYLPYMFSDVTDQLKRD